MPIDIDPHDLDTVRSILHKHVPRLEVRVFGSRVKGTALPPSDLDLVVMSERQLPALIMAELKEDFSESDLPFKVDVLDWHSTRDAFRKLIEAEYKVIQRVHPP